MGLETGIEWTDATWNPWRGCHKVSVGCQNCYMFREQKQYGRDPNEVVRSKTTFDAPLKWAKSGKLKPGSRIFTCSYSDFFIKEADEWRDEAWDIIRNTPYWYLILTKRAKLMLNDIDRISGNVPENVVWMVTAENQQMADMRIPELVSLKAYLSGKNIIGVSVEPQLELVTLLQYLPVLDWVICGGESGAGHRPFDLKWAESLLEECKAANVPFFMKQLGGWPDRHTKLTDFPELLRKREFPEKLEIA